MPRGLLIVNSKKLPSKKKKFDGGSNLEVQFFDGGEGCREKKAVTVTSTCGNGNPKKIAFAGRRESYAGSWTEFITRKESGASSIVIDGVQKCLPRVLGWTKGKSCGSKGGGGGQVVRKRSRVHKPKELSKCIRKNNEDHGRSV